MNRVHLKSSQLLKYSLYLFALCLPLSKTGISIFFIASLFIFFIKKFSAPPLPHLCLAGKIKKLFPSTPINKAIALFMIYCVLSFLWGNHPILNFRGLIKYAKDFLIFYFIIDTFQHHPSLKTFVHFLLLGAVIASLNGVFQYANGIDLLRGHVFQGRVNSTFNVAPFFSSYLSMIIPLSLLYFNETLKTKKWIYVAISGLLFITFFITFTRNTLVCFLMVSFLLLVLGASSQRLQKGIFIAGILMMISISNIPRLSKIFEIIVSPAQNQSLLERIYLWKVAKKMIEEKPIFGHGLNSYSKINKSYFPHQPADMPYASGYLYLAYSHNSFLKTWIEIGVIGLFLYSLIHFFLLSHAFKICGKIPPPNRWKLSLLSISIMTCLLSSFFADFIISYQTRMTFWTLMALLTIHINASPSTFEAADQRAAVEVPVVSL